MTLSGLSPCLPLRFLHADAKPPRSCCRRGCGRWWPALSCTIPSLDSGKGGACTRQALWNRGQSGPTNAWDLSGEQAANPSPSAGLKTAAPGQGVTQLERGEVWVDNLAGLGRGRKWDKIKKQDNPSLILLRERGEDLSGP